MIQEEILSQLKEGQEILVECTGNDNKMYSSDFEVGGKYKCIFGGNYDFISHTIIGKENTHSIPDIFIEPKPSYITFKVVETSVELSYSLF